MKSLTKYINEAKSESKIKTDLENLVNTCEVDMNNEVFVLTVVSKENKFYLYKTNSESELFELYKNIVNNSKEYGRYFTFVKTLNKATQLVNTAIYEIPTFKKYELEKKF